MHPPPAPRSAWQEAGPPPRWLYAPPPPLLRGPACPESLPCSFATISLNSRGKCEGLESSPSGFRRPAGSGHGTCPSPGNVSPAFTGRTAGPGGAPRPFCMKTLLTGTLPPPTALPLPPQVLTAWQQHLINGLRQPVAGTGAGGGDRGLGPRGPLAGGCTELRPSAGADPALGLPSSTRDCPRGGAPTAGALVLPHFGPPPPLTR